METDPKPRPNHARYIRTLRQMTPAQRLAKAIELTEMSRALFKSGLRERFPELSEAQLHTLYIKRLKLCHNSTC